MKKIATMLSAAAALMVLSGCATDGGYYGADYGYNGDSYGYGYGYSGQSYGRGYGGYSRDYNRGNRDRYDRRRYDDRR